MYLRAQEKDLLICLSGTVKGFVSTHADWQIASAWMNGGKEYRALFAAKDSMIWC